MDVNVKKLHPDAKIPEKAHRDDFCYDVWAVSEEEIAPNVWKYGIGLAFEIIPPDIAPYVDIALDFRPRSSIWKTGMVLANSIGTVDYGYRNGVSLIFYHVFPNMPRYKVGDKIGQMKVNMTESIDFNEVNELGDSERGLGGFGSTGLK